MEKKKGIFGDFLKSLIFICIAIVLVLSGYAARKYVESKKESKTETTPVTDGTPTNTTAKTADEMYQDYLAKLKENMSKKLSKNTTIGYIGEDIDNGYYYAELTHDNELYVHGTADTEFEISTDVVLAFMVETNQAGSTLYFVKSDGILYETQPADVLYGNEPTIKKSDYKNIVNVLPGRFADDESGHRGAIFVDIEGNVFK